MRMHMGKNLTVVRQYSHSSQSGTTNNSAPSSQASDTSSTRPRQASEVSSTRPRRIRSLSRGMDRAAAYSGIVYVVFSFIFFFSSGNFPPAAPSLSAEQTVQHYRTHEVGYKVGAAFLLLSGAFYGSFTAAMSQQMSRIPGVNHTVISAQEVSGAWACITFSVPAIFFATTAYRLERDPQITQALNDLSWMMTFMPFSPFIIQNWAFAFAIFSDIREKVLLPRFVGWVNVVSPVLLGSGLVMHCARRGPFAWNGALTFWLTAIVFGLQNVMNIFFTVRAVELDLSEAQPIECSEAQ